MREQLGGSALLERNPQAAATARAAPRLDVSHQQWRSKATKEHTTILSSSSVVGAAAPISQSCFAKASREVCIQGWVRDQARIDDASSKMASADLPPATPTESYEGNSSACTET